MSFVYPPMGDRGTLFLIIICLSLEQFTAMSSLFYEDDYHKPGVFS